MFTRFYLILVFALISCQVQAAEDERRIALVIGNADYTYAPLANPSRDAADMSAMLRDLGFEVTTLLNADLRQMRRAAIAFGRALDDGGVGLFYYAGHGIQVDGQNYLIPLGAAIDYEEHVSVEALSVQQILGRMGGARNRMNIVILDACRNNPLKRSMRSAQNGLAQMDAPAGTYIAYATAPGQTAADGSGKNGLYTEALLAGMQKRGLQIEAVFKDVRKQVIAKTDGKQVPWSSSSITGDFVFSPEADSIELEFEDEEDQPERAGLTVNTVPSRQDIEREKAFWEAVTAGNTAEDYGAYLQEYPQGIYTRLAKLRLQGLKEKETANNAPQKSRIGKKAAPLATSVPVLDQDTKATRFASLAPIDGKSRIVGKLIQISGDTRISDPMQGYIGPEWGWVRGKKLSLRITRTPDGRLRYHTNLNKTGENFEGYLVLDGDRYRGSNSLPFFFTRNKVLLEFWLEQ